MKFHVLCLLVFQCVFASQSNVKTQVKHIAIIIKSDFKGERAFGFRVQAACHHLDWKADIIDPKQDKELHKRSYDFVINLIPNRYKRPKCKNYMAIFHPWHHYFHKSGLLRKKYKNFDGFLLTYSPSADDKNFQNQHLFLRWHPTVQKREYRRVTPTHLFHLCCAWGNRFDDEKFQKLFKLLDQTPFMRFYGGESFQALYPQSYQSSIPFDAEILC